MNFSRHQRNIIESIDIALKKGKVDLTNDFKTILNEAEKLFKTEAFNFWLSEIGKHHISEIPMTQYGVSLAKDIIPQLKKADRNSVPGQILNICECLFTYCNDDDMCNMQGDFHYYFNLELGIVYKESEMGVVEPYEARPTNGNYRIALISELDAQLSEYYG